MISYIYTATLLTISAITAASIPDLRLVNGSVAKEGQFPWQVGVVSVSGINLNYCGGAIISDYWILTAAHCINNADSIVVMYDTLNLDDTDNKVSVTENYVVHEDYSPQTLSNDIGLVRLITPLTFSDTVAPITLAEQKLQPNTQVTVIGWGTTGDDDTNDRFDVLRYITVSTIDNDRCTEVYGSSIITDAVVCTDPGNTLANPCRGDGGDPVIVYVNNNPVHVALFSFLSSMGCENGDFPAGYTRTAFYRDWIRDLTGV